MSLPGMSDNSDRMIALLAQIAENTGATADQSSPTEINIEGSNIDKRIGVIPKNTVVIKESGDMKASNSSGAIEFEPGDQKTIAQYQEGAAAVLAVGATDAGSVRYWLEVDGNPAVGPTRGPLGTVNSPFSFVKNYGGAVPGEGSIRLKALYPSTETGTIELVGRLHLEVLS